MSWIGKPQTHRRGYYDFHAARVRRRLFWRTIFLAIFVLVGAVAVYAVIHMVNH